ncbi:hypothetical protein [Chitinophaga sp. sic0106]|uniref:hypothetical protein n=1 Tax=Chitinophaga sp. sic0106 TaxID=2854785 RepID=UPI001C44317E|nr:hypothetical protein [Chitinophaga sp. sic0106]MBV7532475.1 hypothetical protein [Chitinophaga sp. sic0106]
MKVIFLFPVLLFFTLDCIAQSKCNFVIQQIVIKDSVIIEVIQQVINEEEKSPDSLNLFKRRLGYVNLFVSEQNNGDTVLKYFITPAMYSIKNDDKDEIYSPYYAYINNRLVLVYLNTLKNISDCPYSAKSKRAIRKKINKCLEATKKVTFYDMNNQPVFTDKHFRKDYFKFHAGKTVYILKNQKRLIINNKYQ